MDHLNLFLKEMHAPTELRQRTRQYLRNTRDLELKRSFNSLYNHFSMQLAGEMKMQSTFSILSGVPMFANVERGFLRDLAIKISYKAFDMQERVQHTEPTLSIVVQGTLVRGGSPFSIGQCIGEDVLLTSQALRDRRVPVALTYLEARRLSPPLTSSHLLSPPLTSSHHLLSPPLTSSHHLLSPPPTGMLPHAQGH